MITVISRTVVKRCPFRDETDIGELVITLDGPAPELHELAGHMDRLTSTPVSHEDFTTAVTRLLPPGAEVVTRWRTGPWQVEVRDARDLLRDPIRPAGP